MRDDALPEDSGAGGDGSGTRVRARHATPRKSLLAWANASAGKAIAMAAMPTAVLMGMGLTPRLASADEMPKSPFSGGSCVSQPDSTAHSAAPSEKPEPTPAPTPSASSSSASSSSASSSSATTDKTTDKTSATVKSLTRSPSLLSSSGPKPSPSNSSSASPSPSSSASNEPLGLGDALSRLGNTLTGGGLSPTSASPTPSASPSSSPSGADGSSKLLGAVTKPVGTISSVTSSVKDTTSSVTKTVTTTVTKTVTGAPTTLPPAPAPAAPSSGKGTPYPCPAYDPKALAEAGLEPTPALLPNQPWVLKTSLLTLTGLDYHGIVKVTTENGSVKDVLKFTATAVDIKDLHQIVHGPDGTYDHTKAAPGSTSTIRNGTVTMYTQELKGNLFGLIPVTFAPDSPPPVNVPIAYFTDVTVTQAGQFGGTLTVPGMHGYGNTSPD